MLGSEVLGSDGPAVVVRSEPASQARPPAPMAAIPPTSTTTAPPPTTEPPSFVECRVGEVGVEGDPVEDWATLVVDPEHHLPEDFEPPDLVEFSMEGVDGEVMIREIVVPDLTAMLEDADENGTPLTLVSGYRSHARQQYLFEERADDLGEDEAAARTARPGHSEHQLGTAIDVLTPGMDHLTTEFAETGAGRWLEENAHRYGFVVSYPEGSEDETCYEFEPWHIRYVGPDVAEQMHESGMTPRQWMLAAAE